MSAPAGDTDELFSIAYQDEHLLVVDKAAGLVVHPAKGHREDTLSPRSSGGWDSVSPAARPSVPGSSIGSTGTPPG